MRTERIWEVMRGALAEVARRRGDMPAPPTELVVDMPLAALGLNAATAGEVERELKHRFGGVTLNVGLMLALQEASAGLAPQPYATLGHMLEHIRASLHHGIPSPIAVYVDDEEENLFLFRRKFGKRLRLETFSDPGAALDFILREPEVGLVITDEVMPGLGGNRLCDEVHRHKPFLKFILITGNPTHDADLMRRSLSRNRFFEFIEKPLNLDGKGEEYFELFRRVLDGDVA